MADSAIAAIASTLPTSDPSRVITAAADQAATAIATAQKQTAATITEMQIANEAKNDIWAQQQRILEAGTAASTTVSEEQQLIAERNLFVQRDAASGDAEVLANAAKVRTALSEKATAQIVAINAVDNEPGFVGFLKRSFLRDGMAEDLNNTTALLNTTNQAQAALIAGNKQVADAAIALLPTKTPAQQAAEAEQLKLAADVTRTQAVLGQIKSQEEFFSKRQELVGTSTTLDLQLLNVRVAEISALDNAELRQLRMTKLAEDAKMESADFLRIEKALNLAAGTGKGFYQNLIRTNPKAAAGTLQYAYSGTTSDPESMVEITNYLDRRDRANARLFQIADAVRQAGGTFVQPPNWKELSPTQQAAMKTEHFSKQEILTGSSQVANSTANIAAMVKRSVPTGVIEVPAQLTATGEVLVPASKTPLAPTGKFGELLAASDGDAAVGFNLAIEAVTSGTAQIKTIAKDMAAFYQNVITVENAYSASERKMFGLPPVTSFKQHVQIPNNWSNGSTPTEVELTSIPSITAALVTAASPWRKKRAADASLPPGIFGERNAGGIK